MGCAVDGYVKGALVASDNHRRPRNPNTCQMPGQALSRWNQSIRRTRPHGMLLHECVNLYFHACNAMMHRRLNIKTSIAEVHVSPGCSRSRRP